VAALPLLMLAAAAKAEPLNTLKEVGLALNACWVPPPPEQSMRGMEITVRFAMTRDGKILGEPRFTFVKPNIPPTVRAAYQKAVAEMLVRCTPFSFTPALAGAIAGKIFTWRYFDPRPELKV